MTTFTETAMADRFKKANAKQDLMPTLIGMMNAISHKNRISDPKYRYLLGAEIMIEYIYDWAKGDRTDGELLEMIEITVSNTQADVEKQLKEGK